MNQGRCLSFCARACAATIFALVVSPAFGQSTDMPSRSGRRVHQPKDGPNVATDADVAAIGLVDSLFGSFAPEDPLPGVAHRALGIETGKAAKRPKWSARLARNPHTEDGNPPYVLIDRYGGVQRYVEPSPRIDLEQHVGKTVAVRRDTGGTLLASQLELPRITTSRVAKRTGSAAAAGNGVRLAAQEEPLPTPTPADEETHSVLTEQPPMPSGESTDGEGEMVEAGPMMYEGDPTYEGEGYEGEIYEEGMVVPDGVDPLYLDGDSEFGHCTVCGDGVCGGQGCANGGCGFGSRPVFYARGEYLLWKFDGMNVPALVVSSDDEIFDLDDPIIFGDSDDVLDDARSGFRITLGYWLDDYGKLGIEGDYMAFGTEDLTFSAGSFDSGPPPFIGRPFFSMTPFDGDGDPLTPDAPGPAVQEVDTNNVNGVVTVRIESDFQSAGLHLRRNLCCVSGCNVGCGDSVSCGTGVGGCDSCNSGPNPSCPMCPLVGKACNEFFNGGTRHFDVIYGVRWAQLRESLQIDENLIATDESPDPEGTTFDIFDRFGTADNEFIGGEIGFICDWERRRWSLELASKLAIGNTRQQIPLSSRTVTNQPGEDVETFENRGLLVQPSNAGSYSNNSFSVMPQIGLTGGYQVTQRLRLVAGYNLLYWSRVLRPGDVIDLQVNTEQIPPPDDDNLDLEIASPRFVLRETDLWAHGLNAGIDYRW
jgi:hypothetical protein